LRYNVGDNQFTQVQMWLRVIAQVPVLIMNRLLFGRRRNLFRGHNLPLLIFRGGAGALAFLSMIMAIRLLPVSTAMVIFFTYPAFAAVFSFVLLKEGISRCEALCLLLVLVGAGSPL